MLTSIFYSLLLLILGFCSMLLLYIPQIKRFNKILKLDFAMLPFPYMWIFYSVGLIGSYFFLDNIDIIVPIHFSRIVIPLLLAMVIFFASYIGSTLISTITIVVSLAITVYLQPLGNDFPYFIVNEFITKSILVLFFSVFCIFFRILNIIPHTIIIPSVIMLLGLTILSTLSASPLYISCCAALFSGSLLGFLNINKNEIVMPLDNATCCSIAFLLANLFLLDGAELSFPSCIVFSTIFWAEFITALWNKLFVTREISLEENTNYYKAANLYTLRILSFSITKICLFGIFLGWFQLFSVNQYSMIIVSTGILMWMNTSMGLATQQQSLKEINKNFINDIKQNITEAKKTIDSLSNKEDK